jgi:hypothetical protein
MADKRNSPSEEPQQVFRQFAWHLAGSLAGTRAPTPRREAGGRPRPAKATARR